MSYCAFCGKETRNPKFCSSSCSVTFHNKRNPKRKRSIKYCKKCGVTLSSSRRTVCDSCMPKLATSTLKDIASNKAAKGKHPSWRNAVVRNHCRSHNKNRPKVCDRCGYSKHVEMCHITPLASFSETATLAEVNREENVAILCRNCHWEFDNGLLSLSEFRSGSSAG